MKELDNTPAALEAKPELFVDAVSYAEAFQMLLPSGQTGMGRAPIPLVEIRAYIELFDVVDKSLFVRCVQAQDRAHVMNKVPLKPKTT